RQANGRDSFLEIGRGRVVDEQVTNANRVEVSLASCNPRTNRTNAEAMEANAAKVDEGIGDLVLVCHLEGSIATGDGQQHGPNLLDEVLEERVFAHSLDAREAVGT